MLTPSGSAWCYWLGEVAAELGIDGLELLNPYQGSNRSVGNLVAWNQTHALLGVGGSDAHHVEDLYKVIVDFPGQSVADLGDAFRLHTASARWGWENGRVPIDRQLRQHTQRAAFHPAEQIHSWVRRRVAVSNRRESARYSAAFSAAALDRVMPGTAASASTSASRIALSEPNCRSSARLRFGPMPGTSSSAEREAASCRAACGGR